MHQDILSYIRSQKIAVLAVEMQDGSPHAATVHYAHSEEPLQFFFETSKYSRKCEPILSGNDIRASLVIGFTEGDRTLQLDGTIKMLSEDDEIFESVYWGKFPDKKGKYQEVAFLSFTPSWWRFTDWTSPEGKIIICSTDK